MNTSRKSIGCSRGVSALKMMLANWREIREELQGGCEDCKVSWRETEAQSVFFFFFNKEKVEG